MYDHYDFHGQSTKYRDSVTPALHVVYNECKNKNIYYLIFTILSWMIYVTE